MRINTNSTAVLTGNYLTRAEKRVSKANEKLSSGYKINKASDAPAGYAISQKMRAQIRALEKATDNADTACDFVDTAEGALAEVHDMLQRMNELAVKAANGTNTDSDREAIQAEIDQLCEEIERIAKATDFNDQPILNGNYQYRGYTDKDSSKVLSYSDDIVAGNYSLSGLSVSATPTGEKDKDGNEIYDYTLGAAKVTLQQLDSQGTPMGSPVELDVEMVGESNVARISNNYGIRIDIEVDKKTGYSDGDMKLELEKAGAMRVQVGDNEGQVIEMNIPEISLKLMGIEGIDVTTQEKAKKAIEYAQQGIDYTSSVRSKLGAYRNRLEHTVNSLNVNVESLNNSYSTIKDTDMAEEMIEFTSSQILQQAATSMLSQANQFPQQALQLLQ